MKVVIAGAGSVGRSVARELLGKGHEALLIDRSKEAIRRDRVPGAAWLLGDACELGGLEDADMARADVVVAATGDDKTNLVLSLLAKTEFGVPRTVARVNNPRNEWLFDANWGVDVAVSTPRLMTALVEEAVEVGGLVHLLSLERGRATLMEFTVHHTASVEDRRVGDITWPADSVLVAIVRSGRAFAPTADDLIVGADELFFLAAPEGEARLRTLLGAEESEAAPEAEREDGSDEDAGGPVDAAAAPGTGASADSGAEGEPATEAASATAAGAAAGRDGAAEAGTDAPRSAARAQGAAGWGDDAADSPDGAEPQVPADLSLEEAGGDADRA